MIIFRVGADDAEFIEKEFEPEFTAQDLVNLPNYHIYLKLMIDGVTSRPFSASTLPPMKIDLSAGVKEKIIETSRKLYARPREEVEAEISKWSGMLQVGEGEAKYKADCSNCGKVTMVPFEPKEGRPVYCKDCMFKIKSGELKPQTGFVASRSGRQEEKNSTQPLALLGIEFASTGSPAKAPPLPSPQARSFPPKPSASTSASRSISSTPQAPYKPSERKPSPPSPLLKGLLQKIGGNKEQQQKEVVQLTPPVPKPTVSLSSLKKTVSLSSPAVTPPATKEASEEKKSSLKDLLAKVTMAQKQEPVVVSSVSPATTTVIPPHEDPKISEHSDAKDPVSDPTINSSKKNTTTDPWQKRTVKKEVPEEVLRKVLE